MRKFSFERLPLVNPFSFFSLVIRVVSVRINHSRKLLDRCRKTQVHRAIRNPWSGGYTRPSKTQMKSPENLVVFVDVFSFPKGKNLQVPCVKFSMSKNRFLCQPAPLSSTSASGNPRFFVTLPKTKNSPLKMDGWNTIGSFWDGLFSGAMLVSGRGNPSWN